MTPADVAVRALAIVCAAAVPFTAARAQSPQPPATRTTATAPAQDGAAVAKVVIRQLDGADFALRRAAQLKLNSLGGDALPAVKAALDDDLTGPETKIRLKAALPYLEARAKREGPERARLAWKLAQIRAAYDTGGGGANPRWDAQVHAAIDLFLKLPADPRAVPRRQAEALAAFAKATDAGCDDPLVLGMYHLAVGEKFGRGEGPVDQPFDSIVAKVQHGRYSPVVKFWIASRYVRATRQWNAELTQQAIADFRQIPGVTGLPPTELESCANQFYDALDRIGGGRDVFGKHMLTEAYKAVARGTHGALLVEGRFHLDVAWKSYAASGWGRNVPPANWQGFSDNLAQAAEALEAAWKLDPTDARPAALLITCQLGDKGAQRQGVEDWFARAVEADPDCFTAYDRKLYTLSPWWYGNGYDDAIAFGRECLKTGNWRAGVPMMLVTAHRLASEASGDTKAYYARPEVWADLSAVYEGQLVNFPDDALRRSELASAAAQSGRWDVVRQQFDLLGDRAVVSVFGGKAQMDYLRRKAARLAPAATTTPSTTAPAAPR
jgi:hypothetical protein